MFYQNLNQGVKIMVESEYLSSYSIESLAHYVWGYNIKIVNNTDSDIQILAREWKIIDKKGITMTVDKVGVVGVQPVIKSKNTFSYCSGVSLSANSGVMMGYYKVLNLDTKEEGIVKIPTFSLDVSNYSYKYY